MEAGAGLAYVFEPIVEEALRDGRLVRVLQPYSAIFPGFFLYYPSRARTSGPLRIFVDYAKAKLAHARTRSR